MAALSEVLASVRKHTVSNSKQVKFASDPVMITTTSSTITAKNELASDPRTVSHPQHTIATVPTTHSKNTSKVRGTIPVTDFSDPKRVKNVLVSTPSSENSLDHNYASKVDTSSSDDSCSSSDSESIEATPIVTVQSKPPSKGRGRPRKQVVPVTAEPIPQLKSILKPTVGDKITFEKVKRRGRGCGQCTGCLREDCGGCCYCLDKPKFGGPGKKKQRCALRVCANFVSHKASSSLRGVVNSKGLPLSPDETAKLLSDVGTTSGVTLRPSNSSKSQTNIVPYLSTGTPTNQGLGGVSGTRSIKQVQDDVVECVMCGREKRQSTARSSKFCTVKCLKDWELLNPGKSPNIAEPSETMQAGNLDKPVQRVLKNLQIDMALPGEKKHDPTLSELLEIASSIVEGGITTTTVTTGNKRTNQVATGETPTKKTKISSTIMSIPSMSPMVTSSPANNPMSAKMTISARKEQLHPADVSSWSTEEVERYFESTGECSPIASVLRDQEIDGEALLLLSHDSLVKCLGMKLGPALKVMTHVDKLKLQASSSF